MTTPQAGKLAARRAPAGPGRPSAVPAQAGGLDQQPVDHTSAATPPGRPRTAARSRARPALFILGPIAVAAVAIVGGGFDYRGGALFLLDLTPGGTGGMAPYRVELIDYAWRTVPTAEVQPSFRWDVAADASTGTLRLELVADDHQAASQALQDATQGFLDHIKTVADQALNQPSVGETILQERLEHLRSGLSAMTRQQQAHDVNAPSDSPGPGRFQTAELFEQERSAYLDERDQLRGVQTELSRLEATPVPEHPPIDPELKARAFAESVPLQQDLAELEVQFATLRAEMLNVWQKSTGALDELVAAASELRRLLSGEAVTAASGNYRTSLERASTAAEEYGGALSPFVRSWTQEWGAISRDGEIDLHSAQWLEAQERLAGLLADFLYQATASLTVIGEQDQSLQAETDDQARHHVVTANLTRDFHALKAAQHDFEFAASEIQTTNNFRLAAAVRAGRGLHRRVTLLEQELTIESERVTRERLEQERQERIALLGDEVRRLAAACDEGLDALLDRQDAHIDATRWAADRAADRATAEAVAERIDDYHTEIAQATETLHELAARRYSPVRAEAIKLVSCTVDRVPANLPRRLAYGWAAATTTLLLLLGCYRCMSARASLKADPS